MVQKMMFLINWPTELHHLIINEAVVNETQFLFYLIILFSLILKSG